MPFTAAPIACSRTPKWMFRPSYPHGTPTAPWTPSGEVGKGRGVGERAPRQLGLQPPAARNGAREVFKHLGRNEKGRLEGPPEGLLGRRSSSSPRGAPCASKVSCLCGAP